MYLPVRVREAFGSEISVRLVHCRAVGKGTISRYSSFGGISHVISIKTPSWQGFSDAVGNEYPVYAGYARGGAGGACSQMGGFRGLLVYLSRRRCARPASRRAGASKQPGGIESAGRRCQPHLQL